MIMNNFYYSDDIFSGGLLLKGSRQMGSNLSTEKERLCSNCKDYIGKLNCRYLGKIKVPNVICCSFWKEWSEIK